MNLRSQLSRITTPGRTFIPQIDGLRFVAIMAVIAHHVRSAYLMRVLPTLDTVRGDWVNDVFWAGNFGVTLFFAISGFIIALPFARWRLGGEKPVKLRDYYRRRLTRIEPPYMIHLAFLALLCVLVLHYQPGEQHYFQGSNWLAFSGQHLLASLFYSNGFIYGQHPYPNVVLWSLEVEVQFYLLAPLFLQVFKVGGVWWRRGVLVAAIGLLPMAGGAVANGLGNPYLGWASLLGNLQYFLVGFLLADWQASARAPARRNVAWDGLFILAGLAVVCLRTAGWLGFALPVLIGVGLVAAFRGTVTFRVLGHPWITTIGGMCYTIYLYHLLMISLLIRVVEHLRTPALWLDLLLYFGLMTLVIVPGSMIFFALFERPFMRRDWPARLREKLRRIGHGGKLTAGSTTPP